MLPQSVSPYAAGKIAGEAYVQAYARSTKLDGVSLRYFNIFGPRQDPSSPYSGVISLFAHRMLRGLQPIIFGDGSQTRDFTYVTNVVAANLAALRHPRLLKGVFTMSEPEDASVSLTWLRRLTRSSEPISILNSSLLAPVTSATPKLVSNGSDRPWLTSRRSVSKSA